MRVREITRKVDPDRRSFGAYSQTWGDNLVFDKNSDGEPDILLSFHIQRWQLWLGAAHGEFTLDQRLPRTDRHNCADADFGGPHGARRPDGLVDLYCVRGANKGTVDDKANAVFIQRPRGGFVNEVATWGAADPSGRGRTVSILQSRPGGRPGLFLGDQRSIDYPSLDHIFVNRGGRFKERRTAGLPSEHDTDCSDTGDYDRDGRQDIITCSSVLRLYHNRTTRSGPVRYRLSAGRQGLPRSHHNDAELVDVNRDGWADVVTVSEDALSIRLNRRRAPYFARVDYSLGLVGGTSFCVGAANGDRAPDLLVVQGRASAGDALQRHDWMLVNHGHGRAFRRLRVPQPPRRRGSNGVGDTCSAIPEYDGRRAAWTINNGRWPYRGYRQLVKLTR